MRDALDRLKGDALGAAYRAAYAATGRTVHVHYQGGGWYAVRTAGEAVPFSRRAPDMRAAIRRLTA
jgi:hypothetical protein